MAKTKIKPTSDRFRMVGEQNITSQFKLKVMELAESFDPEDYDIEFTEELYERAIIEMASSMIRRKFNSK